MAVFLFLSCAQHELVQESPPKKIEKYPTQGILHFMYGEIYRADGNYNYANIEYRKALEYDTTATILTAIGESYLLLGKPQKATPYFENALKLDPSDELTRFQIVDLYMKELRFEEAIPLLKEQLQNEPENPDLLQHLAESYRQSGQYDEALAILNKMIQMDDQHPWAYIYAAEIMLEKGRIADAAPYLEAVARKVEPNQGLYEFWIRSLFESKNISAMLEALEFWLDQNPESLSPYYLYIDTQFRSNNFDAGEKVLAKIAHRWQEDPRISYFQGLAAMAKDQVDSVGFYFKRADAFPDASIDLYLHFGIWYWDQGLLDEAEAIADRAIEKFGPSTRWLHMKAMINAQKGHFELAEYLLMTVISVDSTNLNVREDLANVYVDMGKAEEMDSLYSSILLALPDNASILNNYAFGLSRLNMDLDRALKMVNKALKKEKSAAYCDTKAWILYRQQKYKDALKWIKKAMTYSDIGADVLYHQGKILLALDQIEEAKAAFKNSILLDPNNPDAFNALEEIK